MRDRYTIVWDAETRTYGVYDRHAGVFVERTSSQEGAVIKCFTLNTGKTLKQRGEEHAALRRQERQIAYDQYVKREGSELRKKRRDAVNGVET